MKISWTDAIFFISFLLLATIQSHQTNSLQPYFHSEPAFKISHFESALRKASVDEKDLLELWESMLTGRSGPLSKWIKKRYKSLGLSHLFTPSGFHLSAVMSPLWHFLKTRKSKLLLISFLGLLIFCLKGQGALKRMALIKWTQTLLGIKIGFIVALFLDLLFGSFHISPLSFTFSFLFLGMIYSGAKNLKLLCLFFMAQALIAFFTQEHLSPLILILSPLLNFFFGISLPFLFLLVIPLWDWQLHLGLKILKTLQFMVDGSAFLVSHFPVWEIHFGMLLVFVFLMRSEKIKLVIILLCLSNELNWERIKLPGAVRYEFVPKGRVVKNVHKEVKDLVYFEDGKCERKLLNGIWWEKCSPKRRSTRKKT